MGRGESARQRPSLERTDDVRRFVGGSILYTIGTFGVKLIPFLLLPLYTRYLPPSDFGLIALASAVSSVLLVLVTLGLHGSVTYLFFRAKTDAERRRDIGTVWTGLMVSALLLCLGMDLIGSRAAVLLFRDIPYDPYLRLAIGIAFFSAFSLVPLSLAQVTERPLRYVAFSLAGALLTAIFVVWQIVLVRADATGYLLGMLLAGIVMAVPYTVMVVKSIRPCLHVPTLRFALIYSLPLVPHGVAGWLLELSDRVILERFVSLNQLGIYAFGYTLSSAVYFVAAANNAWTPIMFRRVTERGDDARYTIAVFTTYYFVLVIWIGLGLALLADVVVALLAAKAYATAAELMPWIIGGMIFHSLYLLPAGVLFLRRRTGPIALATISAGLLNVIANLVLVPVYGVIGAALATFFSYFAMAVFVWIMANRAFPVAYEYGRLLTAAMAAIVLFFLGAQFVPESLIVETTSKVGLWLVFPVLLWTMGFVRRSEREKMMQVLWAAVKHRLSPFGRY